SGITNLQATTGQTEGKINLSWTAVGDDGNSGTAASYVVKYSTDPITTQGQFDSANTYTQSWNPLGTGESEAQTLSGLTGGTTYYIAIALFPVVLLKSPCNAASSTASMAI
ncbi:MAG: hypothetical protein LHV69_12055, partial [Elusimicrobia bacterium]|nr:hypothetical protein [Candidatus Obscuribacterium magneticum]